MVSNPECSKAEVRLEQGEKALWAYSRGIKDSVSRRALACVETQTEGDVHGM